MAGYKRVNFYELCRLCATNQQKDKTHIFQDEGRKIQLQSKIQSCLSLTVSENDFLPKVVCSKCLRSLEVCYTFRQECVSSESMLSSYFKNYRYTEDFKKSGKVYIKDTAKAPEVATVAPPAAAQEGPKPLESIPFYTLQLPTIVTNQQPQIGKIPKSEVKTVQNYNTINLATVKTTPKVAPSEGLSNVVVNANGEVMNIAQLVDFESMMNVQKKVSQKKEKTDSNYDTGQKPKTPKVSYAVKVEENKINSVILNSTPEFNQNNGYCNNSSSGGGGYQNGGNLEPSTVNLNAFGQDLNQQNFQRGFPLKNQETNQTKTHICEICQKSFKRREHLYQHVKLHTGFRPYSCENCNKSFMRKEHLLRHMTSHSGQKNYTCNICEKSFSRNDNLLKHKKTHEKQASYTCDICQKQFVMKHYYLAHKLTHDSDRCGLSNVWGTLKT